MQWNAFDWVCEIVSMLLQSTSITALLFSLKWLPRSVYAPLLRYRVFPKNLASRMQAIYSGHNNGQWTKMRLERYQHGIQYRAEKYTHTYTYTIHICVCVCAYSFHSICACVRATCPTNWAHTAYVMRAWEMNFASCRPVPYKSCGQRLKLSKNVCQAA